LTAGCLSLFWVGRWGEQLIDAAAVHQIGADKAGEGERAFDGVLSRLGETQQHEGDQRHGDLEAHGVLAGADEVADVERLLDPAEEQLNGLITNDKFCLSRPGRLSLSWWRYPLRLRDPAPKGADTVPDLEGDRGGGHEAPLAGSPSDAAGLGRSPAVGSGLHAHSELGVDRHRLGARRGKRALPTSSGGEP
jgi:hypothetical protein